MEIYIADVECLSDERLFLQKIELLPRERREQIGRYRNAADRRRGLGAGLLLEWGLRRRGLSLLADVPGTAQVQLAHGRYGKPYISQMECCSFNLSHAGDCVAAVFAEGDAGVDVERVRSSKLAMAGRVFTEKEQECLRACRWPEWMPRIGEPGWHAETDLLFTGMWTRKESYVKAVGEGMHLLFADFSVLETSVGGCGDYHLATMGWRDDYIVSTCTRSPAVGKSAVLEIDLEEII